MRRENTRNHEEGVVRSEKDIPVGQACFRRGRAEVVNVKRGGHEGWNKEVQEETDEEEKAGS